MVLEVPSKLQLEAATAHQRLGVHSISNLLSVSVLFAKLSREEALSRLRLAGLQLCIGKGSILLKGAQQTPAQVCSIRIGLFNIRFPALDTFTVELLGYRQSFKRSDNRS